ncbi:hypothetical protein V6C27_14220 [Peptococcaceae bacterium 1198_IL3148]
MRLGFFCEGRTPEFVCITDSKKVVAKFKDLLNQLSEEYEVETDKDGIVEINTDGNVNARFFKSGRGYDVDLELKSDFNALV